MLSDGFVVFVCSFIFVVVVVIDEFERKKTKKNKTTVVIPQRYFNVAEAKTFR